MSISIYASDVMHLRLRPKRHRLDYAIFSFLIDLDRLSEDSAAMRLYSINRFNLFSFFEKDRGDGRKRGLADYVREQLRGAGLIPDGFKISLLTMPRVLGLAFNPLSVYFCTDPQNQLKAVLWEVDNTFGERHSYLIPVAEEADGLITQICTKAFYVSPFLPLALTYRFRFRVPGERLQVHITASDEEGPLLIAAQQGRRQPVKDLALIKLFARLPLQSFLVLAGIHWEALKLWRKGIRLVSKSTAHSGIVTTVLREKVR